MIDRRRDAVLHLVLRTVIFLAASGAGVALLFAAGGKYSEPNGAFARHGEPAAMPRVFVRGTIRDRSNTGPPRTRGDGTGLPAVCRVEHERYQSCGKSRCWKWNEGFRYSNAKIDIEWSSAPLPSSMDLTYSFQYEPWSPTTSVAGDERSEAWKKFAREQKLGFEESRFVSSSDHRIVESCLSAGTQVYVQACVSKARPGLLEACPNEVVYGITSNGDRQAVIDDAADDLARFVAGAALAFFVAALAFLRPRRDIATGLEDRAAPHRRKLGAGWALLAIPPLVGLSVVLMHGSHPPSSWSTGRGGFAFAITALVVWLVFALNRFLDRRRTQFALAPVLATPRSPLAQASGTAELSVRARRRGEGIRAFIGDDVVAFTQLHIREVYRSGKSTATVDRGRFTMSDELDVVDESGDGVIHLGNAILDVELRRLVMPELSPRYLERGVLPEQNPGHVHFIVEERVIKDGQQLYVLGDVSKLEMKTDAQGYRAVRGSPTLGGKDAAPVLVHAGDERGLIDVLTRDARAANSYAAIAALMCSAIAAALIALARL